LACSDNEVEFKVLETVANVHAAEFVRTLFVVELVTRPFQASDVDVVCPLLEGPRSLGLVLGRRLQESSVERSSRIVKSILLVFSLHVSEVHVVVKHVSVVLAEAVERLITGDLVLTGHLERSNGADLTIVFDGVHNEGKSVNF
jgi:hypothetical protein